MLFFWVFIANIIWLQAFIIRRDTSAVENEYDRVCYFTNWAQYRSDRAKFFPEDIDAHLCTHIIHSFAEINERNQIAYTEWNDKDLIRRIIKLKEINKKLKVLIAVGGWNHESLDSPFSRMSSNFSSRKTFIDSVMIFLSNNNLDGLDLDWEFPNQRYHGKPSDKQNFTLLCKELKERFSQKNYILSAAVSPNQNTLSGSYEASKLGLYLDALHLMSYDLAGGWDIVTGHHTAMKGQAFTVEKSLKAWVDGGFPRNKIVLGLATYGRSFKLSDPGNRDPGAPSEGYGNKGNYTNVQGSLAYYEVCDQLASGMVEVFDVTREVYYGVYKDQWVGYDNPESMITKAIFIKEQGLKGAMFWALDFDDFKGTFCGQGNYPLINTVKYELAALSNSDQNVNNDNDHSTSTSDESTSTSDESTSTSDQSTSTSNQSTSTSNTRLSIVSETVVKLLSTSNVSCRSVPPYTSPQMDTWCVNNCALNNCPPSHCRCE